MKTNKFKILFNKIVIVTILLLSFVNVSNGQTVTLHADFAMSGTTGTLTSCGGGVYKGSFTQSAWNVARFFVKVNGTSTNDLGYSSGGGCKVVCWTPCRWESTSQSGSNVKYYIEVNTVTKKIKLTTTNFTCTSCTSPTNPTSITGTTTICSGGTTTLTASGGSSGSGATFQWGTGTVVGGGTIVQNTTSASYTTPTLTSNQSYWVRRIGTTTGCTNTTGGVSTTITVQSTANNPGAISVNNACVGSTVTINNVTSASTGSPASAGPTYYYYYRGGASNVGWQMFLSTTNNSATLPTAVTNTPGNWFVARNSEFGCAGQTNNSSTVDIPLQITTAPSAGTLSGTQTICVGGSSTFNSTVSGGTWSSNNTGIATINSSTGVISGVSAGTATMTYTKAGTGGCSNATATRTVTVDPVSVAGSISGATTVCSGSNSGTLTLSGHTGSIVKWQSSTNGGSTWSDISNTTTTQAYTNLTSTTQYHAVVQSGSCASATTSAVSITIDPVSVAGSISGATTVCSGSNSGTLTLSGHTGSIVKWQSSINGGLNWSDISNTTTSQAYSNLNTTTQYRAVVQSGSCSSVTTSPVTITVSPATVAGTLSGIATVCYGNNSGTITLSGNTGNVVKWQRSTNGGSTWSDISNTTTTQSYTNLTSTTQYRAVVQSGACSVGNTSAITITVYSDLIAGSVSGNQTICSGVVPDSILSVSLPTGGTGSYTYQWQSSSDNSTWSNVGGATLKDYLPGALVNNTYFRRATTSGSCGTVYDASTLIKVNTCSGPGGVAGDVKMWLKADDGVVGDPITTWEDISGNEKHVTTSLGTPTKIAVGKNYHPSISFDGNAGFDTDSILIEHMFIVVTPSEGISSSSDFQILGRKNHNSSSKARVFGFGGNKTIRSSVDSSTFASPDRIRINGKSGNSLSTTKANIISVDAEDKGGVRDKYSIGKKSTGTSYENLNGQISEIICFGSKKSGVDLAKIESYLSIKYGITISNEGGGTNGNYYNSNGDLIWDANDNSAYHNDVIAIGKDNAQLLNQKQSKTSDDNLKVFVDSLVSSNAANAGAISNDRSFIVIGHNNGILKSDSTIDLESPSEIKHRLAREWKITNSNFDDNFALEIEWDSSGAFDLSKIRLLVDDDGDFTNANVYGPEDGLNFRLGSIIVEDVNSSFIPKGSTKYITLGSVDELTVLPIQLLSFYGVENNKTVDIHWETASESNTDYFEILHSIDGINYKSIGKVNAANYSNVPIKYQLTHYIPSNGVNYYKLVEHDMDGHSYSFDPKYVNFEYVGVEYDFIVYPNPITGSNNLYLRTNYLGDISFNLFDMSGKLVRSGLVKSNLSDFILIDDVNIQIGVYNLVISSPDNSFNTKVIKVVR